jgi:hypothetical protein
MKNKILRAILQIPRGFFAFGALLLTLPADLLPSGNAFQAGRHWCNRMSLKMERIRNKELVRQIWFRY